MQIDVLDGQDAMRPLEEAIGDCQATRRQGGPDGVVNAPLRGLAREMCPRLVVWGAGCAAGSALALLGEPLGLAGAALALSTAVAAALAPAPSRSGFGVVGSLPAGFILVTCWALMWGLVGGLVSVPSWGGRISALLGAILLAGFAGAVSWRRGGNVALIGRDGPAAAGFVTLALFFVWVVASQPLALWSRVNGSGTDFLRHLSFIRASREAGLLVPGEPSYPTALSALGGWLSASLAVPTAADALWRAIAPLTFLMLALMLLAIMSTATHLVDRLVEGGVAGHVSAVVAGLVFVQTAWFSTFLSFGNVMNIVVGLALLTVLAHGLQDKSFGSGPGNVVAAAVVAVTANAWQLLLPVAVLAALPWFVEFFGRGHRPLWVWAVWGTSAALTVNGLLGLRTLDASEQASVSTVSNLFSPDWWWWAGLALSGLVVVVAYLRGLRAWAGMVLAMLAGGTALVAALLVWTGSTWELMLYYPVKAMWNVFVIVIPLAPAGAVLAGVTVWRTASAGHPVGRSALRALVVLASGLIIAGVLGRGSAFSPHLSTIERGGPSLPNWSLAVIDALQGMPIPQESEEGAIVMGVIPATSVQGVLGGLVGMTDYMAMEALEHVGVDGATASPVKFDLYSRDMQQVCLYLKEHPNSLRITGPNPAAGPGWLLAAGCPTGIVKPSRWVSLEFDAAWLDESPWQSQPWTYPTVAEVETARGLNK